MWQSDGIIPPIDDVAIPYNMTRVGTCSKCGGPVCLHDVWASVVPDRKTCIKCGAVEKEPTPWAIPYPTIDME